MSPSTRRMENIVLAFKLHWGSGFRVHSLLFQQACSLPVWAGLWNIGLQHFRKPEIQKRSRAAHVVSVYRSVRPNISNSGCVCWIIICFIFVPVLLEYEQLLMPKQVVGKIFVIFFFSFVMKLSLIFKQWHLILTLEEIKLSAAYLWGTDIKSFRYKSRCL